jgi:hypothetical protein
MGVAVWKAEWRGGIEGAGSVSLLSRAGDEFLLLILYEASAAVVFVQGKGSTPGAGRPGSLEERFDLGSSGLVRSRFADFE